ncbi:hypothetical protein NEOLI_004172, partial [Neolecta irregularis DAH-3]
DADGCRGYTRLFSEAGEAWAVLCARLPADFLGLVDAVLFCADAARDLDVVKITFRFWYELKQLAVLPAFAAARELYAPVYRRLVVIMARHMEYPPAAAGAAADDLFDGDREADDAFRGFRHEIGDVLKDCVNVLGAGPCLALVTQKLQDPGWQQVESALFGLRAMAREIPTDEDEFLPRVMDLLPQIDKQFAGIGAQKVRFAAILVVGRYTAWVARRGGEAGWMLDFISRGFDDIADKDVVSASAMALKYFCQDCGTLLLDFLPQLLAFYEKVVPLLDNDPLCEVTEAISHVINAQPHGSIHSSFETFIAPTLSRLARLESDSAICDTVDQITIFVANIKPYIEKTKTNPCIPIVSEILTVLFPIIDSRGSVPNISEKICKAIKSMMPSYRSHMAPLLPQIAEKLVSGFEKYQMGCFLWVAGSVVRELGEDLGSSMTWAFVERLCFGMFTLLHQVDPASIPDSTRIFITLTLVIEDFYRLLQDAIYIDPTSILSSAIFKTIFESCIQLSTLDHPWALSAMLNFLRDVLSYGLADSPTSRTSTGPPPAVQLIVRQITAEYGVPLTQAMFSGMIYSFPRDCVPDGSFILLSLVEIHASTALTWLKQVVNMLQNGLTDDEREKFLRGIEGAENDGPKIRRLLQDFTARYRRRNVLPRQRYEKVLLWTETNIMDSDQLENKNKTPCPEMRILCLHGYTQSGPTFRQKIAALTKPLEKLGHEFIFPTAPHVLFLSDTAGESSPAEQIEAYGWWTVREEKYHGLRTSLEFILDLISDDAPFDGVIGFSQGACIASILTSLLESGKRNLLPKPSNQPPFKFGLYYSGFSAKFNPEFYLPKISTPTLHFNGELDTVVSNERMQTLIDVCIDPKIVRFPGGHFVPCAAEYRQQMRLFLSCFEGDESRL